MRSRPMRLWRFAVQCGDRAVAPRSGSRLLQWHFERCIRQPARCQTRRQQCRSSHLARSDRLTTISVVATDESGSPSYSFHGDGKADRFVGMDDLPADFGIRSRDHLRVPTRLRFRPSATPCGLCGARGWKAHDFIDPQCRPNVTPEMSEMARPLEAFSFACGEGKRRRTSWLPMASATLDELQPFTRRRFPGGRHTRYRWCEPVPARAWNRPLSRAQGRGDTTRLARRYLLTPPFWLISAMSDRLTLWRFLEIGPSRL